jgi:hypothetical protein
MANHLAFQCFIFVLMRFAPSTASTTNDPGVRIAATTEADIFNFLCRLTILSVMLVVTGYLSAPHDWQRGESFSSVTPQYEHFGIHTPLKSVPKDGIVADK